MTCHGRPEDAPLTLKGLIHELSADFTMADEPVIVSGWDSTGNFTEFAVTGISVRTHHGKSVQSLKLRAIEEDPATE